MEAESGSWREGLAAVGESGMGGSEGAGDAGIFVVVQMTDFFSSIP